MQHQIQVNKHKNFYFKYFNLLTIDGRQVVNHINNITMLLYTMLQKNGLIESIT